ncbi:hypothetical protein OSTOST_02932 [Ostertagia ostertagi]
MERSLASALPYKTHRDGRIAAISPFVGLGRVAPMKHIGLTLCTRWLSQELIKHHVVEFVNECRHVLASVADAAFRFESNGTLDLAFVKNQKRRAERPLAFGDVIEWDDVDMTNNRVIFKFQRVAALFECRVQEQKFQILVSGVVSPEDKFHFWSQYFPHVRLGLKTSEEVLPNVTVSAWLNLCIDEDGSFRVEFDSFEKVDHDGNITAAAPWNRNNSKYTTLILPQYDDGLETQIVPPDSLSEVAQCPQEMFSVEGICTGKRLIFCKELSHYEIVVALIKNAKDSIPLGIGVSCEFDAVWNEYEKRYIVTRYKTKGLPCRLGSNGLLRTSVKAVENYPGLFKSEQFGYIDDPRGVLALLHLSAYQRSSVVVTLEDKPSHQSDLRFRIVDVQPDKAPKLEKWMEETEIIVEDAEGVVLNSSSVYSKNHGNIFFDVPEQLRVNLSPGKLVKFSAKYQHGIKLFTISKIVVLPGEGIVSVEKRLSREQDEHQVVFRVNAVRTKNFRYFLRILYSVCSILPRTSRSQATKNLISLYWITRSSPETGAIRSARTPFVVVSIGNEEPPDYVLLPFMNVKSSMTSKSAQEVQSVVPHEGKKRDEKEIEVAMDSLGLGEDRKMKIGHAQDCTKTRCAADCLIMNRAMMLTDEKEDFLDILAERNLPLFLECVNKMFT